MAVNYLPCYFQKSSIAFDTVKVRSLKLCMIIYILVYNLAQGLHFHCRFDDKYTKYKPQVNAKYKFIYVLLIIASGQQGHHVLAEVSSHVLCTVKAH